MRILNTNGTEKFRDWIKSLKSNPTQEIPDYLLNEETFSYDLNDNDYKFSPRYFPSKLQLIKEVSVHYKKLSNLLKDDAFENFFTTLSLLYFDSICKGSKEDGWRPNQSTSYYILGDKTGHASKNYSHRIYGPLMLYLICPGKDGVDPFFADENGEEDPGYTMGQFESTVGSNMEIFTNQNIIKFCNKLYVDKDGNRRRGIYNKVSARHPGGIRRLPTLHRQCKLNYNLYNTQPETFFNIFPENFIKVWQD